MLKYSRILFWLPRIMTILAILFVSIFALDAFQPELTVSEQWGGFVIHLVPSYLLTVILIVAWKWEYVGGILFLVIGLLATPYVFLGNYQVNNSLGQSILVVLSVTIPFAIVGLLFLVNHFRNKKFQSAK